MFTKTVTTKHIMFTKTVTTKGTWCGRKGTSINFHLDSRRHGKRINAHVWDDDPEVVKLTAMTGSFWRGPAGIKYAERTCYFHSEAHIVEMATQMAKETFK